MPWNIWENSEWSECRLDRIQAMLISEHNSIKLHQTIILNDNTIIESWYVYSLVYLKIKKIA